FLVGWGYFHRRMDSAGRGPTDQEGDLESLPFHFTRHVYHLVQRGRYQAAQADHVCPFLASRVEYFLAGHHHAKIDDLVIVASQDQSYNVLAYVVHVPLDRREDDLSLRLTSARSFFFGFHEGKEVGNGLFHDPGALDDLREEHLA